MSTGADIIIEALQNIGVHSVASPASPEAITRGMRNLNSMMELWLSQNIQLGFTPLEVPGDELNEPPDTTNGIATNLALYIAPAFDNGANVVSPTLRADAQRDFRTIKSLYQVIEVPAKVVSSTLPLGQGNRRYGYWRTYFPRGARITN